MDRAQDGLAFLWTHKKKVGGVVLFGILMWWKGMDPITAAKAALEIIGVFAGL